MVCYDGVYVSGGAERPNGGRWIGGSTDPEHSRDFYIAKRLHEEKIGDLGGEVVFDNTSEDSVTIPASLPGQKYETPYGSVTPATSVATNAKIVPFPGKTTNVKIQIFYTDKSSATYTVTRETSNYIFDVVLNGVRNLMFLTVEGRRVYASLETVLRVEEIGVA